MPIYAYRCTSCGHAKDVLQKVSDPLLTECPACGAATFVKQVTAAGFQLKGSGWYVTDFRGGNAGASKPEADGKEAGDKSTDKSPDKGAEKGAEKGGTGSAAEKASTAGSPAPAPAASPSPPAPAPGGSASPASGG